LPLDVRFFGVKILKKFDFGWGSAPGPIWGAHSTPLTPWLHLRGPTFRGGEERRREGKMKEKRRVEKRSLGPPIFTTDRRP